MDAGHMYNYNHLHRTMLLEHKCNFRLALMYSKSFLSPLWKCLLFASGGALAIQKYFYYLVDWHCGNNSFPVLSSNTNSSDHQFVMTSGRATSTYTIPRAKNEIGKRTLGVRVSPHESFKDKFTYRQQQELKWIRNISIAPLSWGET